MYPSYRVSWVGSELRHVVYLAVLNQAVVSGSMFALNVALIGLSSPAAYGQFVLALALSLLSFGAQNALILLPLNVLLAPLSGQRRRVSLRMLSTIDAAVLGLTSISVAGLSLLFGLPPVLAILAGALALTNGMREFQRSLYLTDGKPAGLLALDIITFSVALATTAALSFAMPLTEAALTALIVGNLSGLAFVRQPTLCSPSRLPRMLRRYAPYWTKSRWALFGAWVTEAHLRLYVFVIEFARGSAALGLIYAGRVLVNPVMLLAFAWTRAIRPIIARQLADGDKRTALHTLFAGTAVLVLIGAAYAVVLNACLPFIKHMITSPESRAFLDFLPLWSLFAVLAVPAICIGVYLQAAHRYQALAVSIFGSVLVSGALLCSLFFGAPLQWAIYSLMIGEVVLLTTLLAIVLPEALETREVTA